MRIFSLVLIAALTCGSRALAAMPIKIRVYHTNDVHGWIMPRPDKLQTRRLIGGAAAFASLIGKEAGPKLILDAGDWWQGTPEGGALTKGMAVTEVFNAIGYDAVVIGNHEYDNGIDFLRHMVDKLKMPVLSANTFGEDGKLVAWARPWIIKEVAGVKVGIFGLTTANMANLSFPKHIVGLVFRREVDVARAAVKALKRQGATVIIAVTHIGLEEENHGREGDRTLAREVPGIDLIVGGHSHTFLNRPIRIEETLIVQAGRYLEKAGRAELVIDPKTRKVVASSAELIELWPDRVGEDPAVKAIVAKHTEAVGMLFETVIASAPVALGRESDRENAVGDWMTDCYREMLGTDIAFINGGAIRADIPAGPVTLRALFNAMPFDNLLVKLMMKGVALRAVFDHGVGMERIAQISGAKIEYYRPKPAHERIAAAAIAGAPLDDAKTYSIATLDFLANRGDGYSVFDRFVSSEATGALARDLLNECARKQSVIAVPASGRLKLREN